MQASISYSPFLSLQCSKLVPSISNSKSPQLTIIQTSKSLSIKAAASDASQVDYTSMASSVFPAEACETVGGDACNVEMFPETKPNPNPNLAATPTPTPQAVDREYLEYNSPKTVFIAEACDDLGGEFCDPAYQSGSS